METPIFSVVIPVYNVAAYLNECLASLHEQTFSAWEGCCTEDGSTDESGNILVDWIRKDKRFRATFQRNAGLSAARNRALPRVEGTYVGFVDSDDAVAPWWLEESERLLQNEPVDLLRFAPLTATTHPPKVFLKACHPPFILRDKEHILTWGWRDFLIYSYMQMRLIRREIAIRETFPVGVRHREDTLYDFKLLPHLTSVAVTDAQHYFYRCRPQSLLTSRQTLAVPLSVFAGLEGFPPQGDARARRALAIYTLYTVVYWLWSKPTEPREGYDAVHEGFKRAWQHLGLDIARDLPVHWRVPARWYWQWKWTVPLRLTSALLRTYGKLRSLFS